MPGVTYKCPSCGAYLVFDPDTQKWSCDFCKAEFTEKELLPKSDEYAKEAEQEAREAHANEPNGHGDAPAGQAGPSGEGSELVYHCPSCGSEIMTDQTTVATQCYYCHNPVVLQGKLTAAMKPDAVLPFVISKDKAVETFMKWAGAKKFIPKGFFSKEEVQRMTGVYYPHFVTEAEIDGSFTGEGQNVSTMDMGNSIVTKTDFYSFRRRADIRFANIMRPALQSVDRKLSDGIHPFPLEDVKPFSSAYLSGFLAERRDIEAAAITKDVQEELTGYVRPLLSETVNYNAFSGNASADMTKQKTQYVLLPTWVLTYQKRQGDVKPYYYVMNGRTGAVCGKLPINRAKLNGVALLIAAIVFLALCFAGYFLY